MKHRQEGCFFLAIFDESQISGEEKLATIKAIMGQQVLMINVGDEKDL